MDLGEPLAALLPTLQARVLRTLLNDRGWMTGADVHRVAGAGSDNGVRRVLAAFADQGIVRSRRVGRTVVYTLNRDHVLCEPLLALAGARTALLDRLRGEIEGWTAGVPACHASVFGSFARGNAGTGSDLDLLVVLDPSTDADLTDPVWVSQLAGLERHVTGWTGNPAQIVDMDVAGVRGLREAGDPLLRSWLEDGLHLVGVPLRQVLGATARATGTSETVER